MHDAPDCGPEKSLSRSVPETHRTGQRGERAAADFLVQIRRYKIAARNWRNPDDEREELDLVAWDEGILVFVEVKTRAANASVPGFFHVGAAKKRILRRAARAYVRRMRPKPRTFRFDVVEVELAAGAPVVRHFIAVPLFQKWDRG